MIIKSYEIQKNISNFIKYNLFLLYGENDGLKKDIKETISLEARKIDNNTEILSLYENDITNNEENFYNSIYSGSLFGSNRIIIINNATDKIVNLIKNITGKCSKNIFIIIFSDILEKKSKLRNLFETNNKTLCVPCYSDSETQLQIIAKRELGKDNIILSQESINLLIEKSNFDRGSLKNEIEKIRSYSLNKNKIEINEIKTIINFAGEHKSDHLINECLCGNILQYKKILSEMYTNAINQIFMLRILSNKVQRLLRLKKIQKDFNSLDSLLSSSKPPIFWKEKPTIKKQLNIWKLDDLKSTINEINDVEIVCKKNPQISKIVFFNFFSKLCKKASSYSLLY